MSINPSSINNRRSSLPPSSGLREREWEVESLRRELNTKNSSMDKIRNEKMVLEKELTMLQDQMTTQVSQVQVLESSPDDLEVSFLRDTVSQLEIDCKNAVDERDMLQSEMASLQAKLSQLQDDCDRYRRQSEVAGKTGSLNISRYEMQVQNAVKQRESFKQQLDDLREELKKARETISRLQRDVLQSQNDANKYKEESVFKTHKLESIQEQNVTLEETLENLRSELTKCQATVDVQKRQLISLQETTTRHEKTIQEYEITVKTLHEKNESAERDRVLLNGKLSTLQASQGKLQERVKEWESVEVQLRKRVGELEIELEVHKEKGSEDVDGQLASRVDDLQNRLDESVFSVSDLQGRYDISTKERDELRKVVEKLNSKVVTTTGSLRVIEEEKEELERSATADRQRISKLEVQLDSVTKAKDRYKADLESEKSKVSQLKKEGMEVRQELSESRSAVDRLSGDLEKRDKTIADLKSKLLTFETKVDKYREEAEDLQQKIHLLENEVEELRGEMMEMQKRLGDSEANYKTSAEERDRINEELQKVYKDMSNLQSNYNILEQQRDEF